jgi:hypothetical protein
VTVTPPTGIEHGDQLIEALAELGGEASTDELAEQMALREISTLVAAGKLAKAERIIRAESGHKKGNPRWRLPEVGEQGFMG